ncbi:NUDIX hydrolase [Geminicoccus roseus]|uniref:NUDIX hydrolase n=1 Tax=Geminicoccus roseus TaxID=404900 RepID=UPI000426DC30|nr:NUDIX hydrolase [Geminicoccus roseus]
MSSNVTMHAVDRIEAHLEDGPWPWAVANRERVRAHWDRLSRANPALFNGQVLIGRNRQIRAGCLQVRYVAIDYASFLTFRDLGFPDPSAGNCFGMAALRSADGAYVLGVMAGHTANAGRIYFPAGTPDPADVLPDGRVDLQGNVLRELAEETGIRPDEVEVGQGWTVVIEGGRTALMREIRIDLPAERLRARIVSFLRSETRPEFSDVRLVRSVAEAEGDGIPTFVQAYLRQALGAG